MLPSLFAVMNAAGLHIVHDFRLWIATQDGTKRISDMTGVIAVQYKRDRHRENGKWTEPPGKGVTRGHYDESIVYDDDWHPEDDLPYARQDMVGMVKHGVAEVLRDPKAKGEILNLVKKGVAEELRAASTREEVLRLVKKGVAEELRAGVGASGVTAAQGAEAAVGAKDVLGVIKLQLSELTNMVAALQAAASAPAPAAGGGELHVEQ
jgi:hypothetical protein